MPVGKRFNSNAEEEPENPDYPKGPAVQGTLRAARRTKTPLGPSQGDFLRLRAPNMYNLRADPFEQNLRDQ